MQMWEKNEFFVLNVDNSQVCS